MLEHKFDRNFMFKVFFCDNIDIKPFKNKYLTYYIEQVKRYLSKTFLTYGFSIKFN